MTLWTKHISLTTQYSSDRPWTSQPQRSDSFSGCETFSFLVAWLLLSVVLADFNTQEKKPSVCVFLLFSCILSVWLFFQAHFGGLNSAANESRSFQWTRRTRETGGCEARCSACVSNFILDRYFTSQNTSRTCLMSSKGSTDSAAWRS